MKFNRRSLQQGVIHFSLAIFIAGLMTIGTFVSSEITTLINKITPATPTAVVITQPQTPIGFAQPVTTDSTGSPQTTSPTSPATVPVTTTASPAVATASPAVQTPIITAPSLAIPTGTKDCGTDIQCFITASTICSPAAVNYAASMNLFGYITANANTDLQISPKADGTCLFTNKTLSESFIVTSAGQKVATADGLSASDLSTQVTTLSNSANKATIGSTQVCTVPPKSLAAILTNWTQGNMSTQDFDGYQCTVTAAPIVKTVIKK